MYGSGYQYVSEISQTQTEKYYIFYYGHNVVFSKEKN